jgi:hypothetical protein
VSGFKSEWCPASTGIASGIPSESPSGIIRNPHSDDTLRVEFTDSVIAEEQSAFRNAARELAH